MPKTSIRLIPCGAEHAEIWHKWRNERHMQMRNPVISQSVEELALRLAKTSSDLRELYKVNAFRWMVEADGLLVGTVSLSNPNPQMRIAEIGYGIGEEFQRCGFGTLAVKALVEKVFQETELRRLLAYVHVLNVPSFRILERLGFQREGLLRNHFLIQGQEVDQFLYAILRSDFVDGGA